MLQSGAVHKLLVLCSHGFSVFLGFNLVPSLSPPERVIVEKSPSFFSPQLL